MTTNMNPRDHVAFRVGQFVSSDLRLLFVAAVRGYPVTWYTRAQMTFMATCGPQWGQFSKGPALRVEKTQPKQGEDS